MQKPRGQPGSGTPASVLSSVPPSTDPQRRRFLFSLSAGGAGAAALAVTPAVAAVLPAAVSESSRIDAGYQETDHVRHYYRTARL